MPGIDAIISAIMEQANAQAAQTQEQAQAQAQVIRSQAEVQAQTMTAQMENQAAAQAREYTQRMDSMADLSCRRENLMVKQALLSQLFDRALELMAHLPPDQYGALAKKIMLQAAQGWEAVVVSASEKVIDQSFVEDVNHLLSTQGRSAGLTLSSEHEDMAGGFILRKSGVETNCTWDMLVRQERIRLEKEAATQLFEM